MTKKTGKLSFKYVVIEISIMHCWFNHKAIQTAKFALKTNLLWLFVINYLTLFEF